jgi:hypothetical protein
MTPNRSLGISLRFQELSRTDFLGLIGKDFPFDLVANHVPDSTGTTALKASRDRVYNAENTLLTMLVSAFEEDRSLKQGVNIFKQVFERNAKMLASEELVQLQLEQRQQSLESGAPKKRGRPRSYKSQIQKSKVAEVSDNTAAFTKARIRLDSGLVDKVFRYSSDSASTVQTDWLGMVTFVTDGSYFQMQDTPELRKKYFVKQGDHAYPQGLLQGLIRQGTGQIANFRIGTRHQSELELVRPLIEDLPVGSLLLADDLYCAYAIFALVQAKGCHLIVPGKRDRNYTTIRQIATGDEIVELKKPKNRSPWMTKEEWAGLPARIEMRRIAFVAPEGGQQQYVQYTTLTDDKINSAAIIAKYFTRWEIEITIREIKTLMGMNIARSKTEPMVLKEMTIALTAYNMVRRVISESVDKTDFSPQGSFVQECFETDSELLVDKAGRVYHHWSPGRNGWTAKTDQ